MPTSDSSEHERILQSAVYNYPPTGMETIEDEVAFECVASTRASLPFSLSSRPCREPLRALAPAGGTRRPL